MQDKSVQGNQAFRGIDIKDNFYLDGIRVTAIADEINYLDNDDLVAADLDKLANVDATASEINNAADVSERVYESPADGTDVDAGVQSVELNHSSAATGATIADAADHEGLFIVKNTSSGGTASHTLTLTSGTFDGTNDTATLDSPGEALVVYFDSNGDGVIVENIDSVSLSSS